MKLRDFNILTFDVYGTLIDWESGMIAGLASAWIHRRHDKQGFGATMDPGATPRHDFRFTSMADLVAAHAAELAAGG